LFVSGSAHSIVNARVGEGARVPPSYVVPFTPEKIVAGILLEGVRGTGGKGGGINALLRVVRNR